MDYLKKDKVICAYCEKEHYGEQVWDDQLEDYVCLKCVLKLSKDKNR